MIFRELLVHERTLLGALDSYFKQLVHTQPFLVNRFEDKLDVLAEQWLLNGGENRLDAIDPVWLCQYILQATDTDGTRLVVNDFQNWLYRQELIETRWIEV